MKPTVPETGTIIRIEGENAVIMMKGGKSCKGCGMARIGLCRAGDTSLPLTAKNIVNAGVGDTVEVALDRGTKVKGYFMAYLIPVFSLLSGTLVGQLLGEHFSMQHLDVAGGFLALLLASLFSFKKLKDLDATHMLVAKKIISDNIFKRRGKFRGGKVVFKIHRALHLKGLSFAQKALFLMFNALLR